MLQRVDRILLRVPGLESAVRYYRDVLGMKLAKQERSIASFSLGDDSAELVLHADPDLPGEAIYFRVDDVRAMYRDRAKLKLTFSSPPVQVSRGYRATAKDPFGTVLLLLDRTADSPVAGASAPIEDAKAAGGGLFGGVEATQAPKRETLVTLYTEIGRTADDLPYTPQFEKLYRGYVASYADPKPTRAETWRHLLNQRKAGKLPKLGESKSIPPDISPEDQKRLRQMLGDDLGRRDRLPYSSRFDEIVDAFNKTQTRALSPHFVWRLVARLGKKN
ncbi:MAG TPA: VOC family protein [Tepidisphaeraceae bacterium]|jgi:catechol 2,3-dioxygenase-like lactoylglutathione lyase family enzyme|nr:VOC family protein [Tepidisphaeraceae bacterium]